VLNNFLDEKGSQNKENVVRQISKGVLTLIHREAEPKSL
jgi:hypothetical protein